MGTEIEVLHKPFKKYLITEDLKFRNKGNRSKYNRDCDDGVPDFEVLLKNGIILFIEFKTKEKYFTANNGLNKKQIEWKNYLISNEYKYMCTYMLEEAINFVRKHK